MADAERLLPAPSYRLTAEPTPSIGAALDLIWFSRRMTCAAIDPTMTADPPSVIKSVLQTLLSAEVTGVVTWIGTILTVIGLGFTYHQAREARIAAAEAAKGATEAERAVRRVEHQSTLADAAHISAQIGTVIQLVGAQQHPAVQALFGTIRRQVNIMLVRSPPLDSQVEIIRRNLKTVDAQIIKSITDPTKFKPTIISKALSGLADTIIEWEQSLKSHHEA